MARILNYISKLHLASEPFVERRSFALWHISLIRSPSFDSIASSLSRDAHSLNGTSP